MAHSILTKSQRNALEIITGTELARMFYLAGGTALAIQLGHRYSEDFDFFSKKSFQTKTILTVLKDRGTINVVGEAPNTLHLLFNSIKASFFQYEYRLLSPLIIKENGLRIASIPDIAAMKIAAICSRGSKKDFIDLYVVCTQCFPLPKAIEYFNKKIKPVKYERYHILRSLNYFDDAEEQDTPKMIDKITWKEVKSYFEEEVRMLTGT